MGLFGRALAGAGEGASQIASKYIDEQLVEQRAQVLADIQRNSAVQMDQYTNSPGRRAAMADLEGKDIIAKAGATDTAALNTASNIPLMQASIDRANQVTYGTMGATAAAAGMKEGAVEAAKPQRVPPGEDLVVNGIKIFHNDTMTAGEASLAAYREGLKGQRAADRDRVTEATITSLAKRLDDNQKDLDKLLADNPDAMNPSAPETHFFGEDTPGKPKPAYQNYQRLMRERAGLAADFKDITSKAGRGGAAKGGDPLGIFGSNAGPGEGGDSSLPAPMRNNNPGALMPGGKLASYPTLDAGIAAADANLASYKGKYGADTISKVIAKWAPPSENDTPGYIAAVAKRTGIGADATIDLDDPATRKKILEAIFTQENGADISTFAPAQAGNAASAADPLQTKYAARLTELKANPPATKSIMAKVSPEAAIEAQMNAMPGEPREEVNGQPNPQYPIWQRTYGARFEELRRQLEAIRTGTTNAFETRLQRFKEQEARGGR